MASEAGERGEPKSYWGMAARECDSCKSSPALLFCRADSAFLCGGCDTKVHGANKLASRHERVWMCEVCEQAPASVTCKADAAALCFTCDSDIHSANPLSRRHERVPIVPFYESPTAKGELKAVGPDLLLKPSYVELDDDVAEEDEAASWLLPRPTTNTHLKLPMEPPEHKPEGYFFSDVDPYLDLDYASSMDARFHQTDSLVPVQAKTTAAAHPPPPPPLFIAPDVSIDLDFTRSKASYASHTTAPSLSHSVSSSEVGVVPDGSAMTDITNPYGRGGSANPMTQLSGFDREARVLRYREKRKNRKFEKTIRYASRKAYAETRPRVKGRFAKRTEIEAEVDRIYSSAALLLDSGYGVVPSY